MNEIASAKIMPAPEGAGDFDSFRLSVGQWFKVTKQTVPFLMRVREQHSIAVIPKKAGVARRELLGCTPVDLKYVAITPTLIDELYITSSDYDPQLSAVHSITEVDLCKRYLDLHKRCTEKQIDFNVSLTKLRRVIQSKTCFYTGVKLSSNPRSDNYLTIDRIDPDKGYTDDNIVPCALKFNQQKSNFPLEMVLQIASAYEKLRAASKPRNRGQGNVSKRKTVSRRRTSPKA